MDDELNKIVAEIQAERKRISLKYGKEKKMKIPERLKSPVFWTQLVLLIAETLKLCGLYDMPNDILNTIQDIITLSFQVFAGLNNPTDRKNF